MASANVDLVRSIFAAWERGDFSSTEWAHPEIEYVFADGPGPASWTGTASIKWSFRDFLGAFDEARVEAYEYRELDDERLLVLARWSGRGKTSGMELGRIWTEAASLFHIHEGKVTRLALYFDAERALADLGLARRLD